MTPATFMFESASSRTWDDGTTALILTGTEHRAIDVGGVAAGAVTRPVSVTVFLGRGDDITENIADITRALTEGDPDRLVDLAIEAGGHCQRTVGYVGPESRALTEGDKP